MVALKKINFQKLTRVNFYSTQPHYHDITVVNIHQFIPFIELLFG